MSRTTKKTAKETAPKPTSKAQAMLGLALGVLRLSFKLRALGQRSGATTPWGGGSWGLMRSLALEGPQTVPEAARKRPVARQRIQKIANELEAEGLIEFVDNPAHKRSKFMKLTPKGERRHAEISAGLVELSADLAADISEADLKTAARVLEKITEKVAAKIGQQ